MAQVALPHPCEPTCKEHRFHIATGQRNGAYYTIGRALASDSSGDVGVWVTNGSVDNLKRVKEGEAAFGLVQSDVLDFEDGRIRYSAFKVVGTVHLEPLHIFVRRKLQYSSVDQFRGSRVGVGVPLSGTQFTAKTILGVFGLSWSQLTPDTSSYSELEAQFAAEEIDAAFVVNATPPDPLPDALKKLEIDVMRLGTQDLVRIAARSPKLYQIVSAADPQDPQRGKRYRTIAVTSVLIASVNDTTNSPLFSGIVKEMARTLFYHTLDRRYDAIMFAPEPFRLFGSVADTLRFHPAAVNVYHEENPKWHLFHPVRHSSAHAVERGWFPLFCALLTVGLVIPVFSAVRHRNPTFVRKHFWLFVAVSLLCILVFVPYAGMYFAEQRANNPDITAGLRGLGRWFKSVAGFGDVAAITPWGRFFRGAGVFLSAFIGVVVVGRAASKFAENKMRKVLKMVPKGLKDHVVICNWSEHTAGIIDQMRSSVLHERKAIVIVAPEHRDHPGIESCLNHNEDVHFACGDPADDGTLARPDVAIHKAAIVVILARNREDLTETQRVFWSLMNVLDQSEGRARLSTVAVELIHPNESIQRGLRDMGGRHGIDVEVVSVGEVASKRIAQAAITPAAVRFVAEILSASKNSNEVYTIPLPDDFLEEFRRRDTNATFSDFTADVLKRVKTKLPIIVIGVSALPEEAASPGRAGAGQVAAARGTRVTAVAEPHFNPKPDAFDKLRRKGRIVEAIAVAWERPPNAS